MTTDKSVPSTSSTAVPLLQPTSTSTFPTLQVNLVKFNGTNYPSWSKAIRKYLMATQQLSFLVESRPDGSDAPAQARWDQIDAGICTMMWGSMDTTVRDQFMECDTAQEIWNKCALIYSGKHNMSRVCDVWEELFELQLGTMTLADYYSRFTTLKQRLKSYLPYSADPIELNKRQEDMLVMLFLKGLGPSFSSFRQQITSQGTLPSDEEVFSRIQRCPSFDSAPFISETSAMMVHSEQSGRGRGRGQGRGPAGGRTGSSNGGRRNSVICAHCNRSGHKIDTCYVLHPELRPNNRALQASIDGERIVSLTQVEYDALVHSRTPQNSTATLAQCNPDPKCLMSGASRPWIIDSGATHHMTGDQQLLSATSPSPSTTITLADGSKSEVSGKGCVSLSASMSLPFVYHVPNFPYNLLSVSSLTHDLDCLALFSPTSCVFQDRKTGRRIGGGRESGGLYLLDQDLAIAVTAQQSTNAYKLHCRLGHPSVDVLR